MIIVIECPKCGGSDLSRDGKHKTGSQRYKCKDYHCAQIVLASERVSRTTAFDSINYGCPHCGHLWLQELTDKNEGFGEGKQ